MLIGTLVNTLAVLVGTTLGRTTLRGLPAKWHASALGAVGLVVIIIGIATALPAFSSWTIYIILSMVAGTFAGEALKLEERMEALSKAGERLFGASGGEWAHAGLAATLIFCVGPMSFLGAIQDGLGISHATLFAKSALDGLTSVALAATMGPGVYLAAVPVLLYQGSVAVLAHFAGHGLGTSEIVAMSGVGGALIAAIGVNMLGIARLRVSAMLPALVFAPLGVWLVARLNAT